MSDKPFLQLALEGYVLADEIDDFIEAWHQSDSEATVYEYLGMTFEEYSLWATDPDMIDVILSARHSHSALKVAVNDNLQSRGRIAARSDEAGKLAILRKWIAAQPDR